MKRATRVRVLVSAAALVVALAPAAHAQTLKGVEIGTTLAGLTVNTNGGTATAFGVPSGTFGLANPSVYMSLFVAPKIAIEPQLGLIVFNAHSTTEHFITFLTQVDYFFKGTDKSSPFIFGNVGLVSVSGFGATPATFGGGIGYRMRIGDRLAVRFDGKFAHYTQNGGNTIAFGVSLGGLFHQK